MHLIHKLVIITSHFNKKIHLLKNMLTIILHIFKVMLMLMQFRIDVYNQFTYLERKEDAYMIDTGQS